MAILRKGARAFLLVICLTFRTACVYAQNGSLQTEYLVHAIETHNIFSIEVFGVPPETLFRINVTPSRLEDRWDYKLVLRDLDVDLESREKDLIGVLKKAAIKPSQENYYSLDVRWGFHFFSRKPKGKLIASIYFDGGGRHGAFNDSPVSFNPDLLPQLKRALHASIN